MEDVDVAVDVDARAVEGCAGVDADADDAAFDVFAVVIVAAAAMVGGTAEEEPSSKFVDVDADGATGVAEEPSSSCISDTASDAISMAALIIDVIFMVAVVVDFLQL